MQGKGFLIAVVGLLVWASAALASTASCDAVINLAVVYYPPSVAVSYTSSKDGSQRYCRFSINGYVADESAPEGFKKTSQASGEVLHAMAVNKKPDSKFFVEYLPRLLFAADERIDSKLVDIASQIIQKNLPQLVQCYQDFWFGKNDIKYAFAGDQLSLQCFTTKNNTQLETAVFQARPAITRTVLISR